MKKSFYIALLSALLTAGLLKAAPALAQTPAQVRGEVAVSLVHTGDLDLSTEAGRRQLDTRIANAAREVCGAASDVDIAGKNDIRECRNETIAKAKLKKDVLLAAARTRDLTIAVTAGR